MLSEPVSLDRNDASHRSLYLTRLTTAIQEGTLIGVKLGVALIIALFAVGWVLNDYAAVREQARYVAAVRAQQQQRQAAPDQQPSATPPAATPGAP